MTQLSERTKAKRKEMPEMRVSDSQDCIIIKLWRGIAESIPSR